MFDFDIELLIHPSKSLNNLHRFIISRHVRNDAKVIQIGQECTEIDTFSINIFISRGLHNSYRKLIERFPRIE